MEGKSIRLGGTAGHSIGDKATETRSMLNLRACATVSTIRGIQRQTTPSFWESRGDQWSLRNERLTFSNGTWPQPWRKLKVLRTPLCGCIEEEEFLMIRPFVYNP